MATISITVPDALIPRITTAMRALFPQFAGLGDAPAFKAVTANHWRSLLSSYEAGVAETNAASQVAADGAGIG